MSRVVLIPLERCGASCAVENRRPPGRVRRAATTSEFFGKESLTAKLKGHYRSNNVRGPRVEDIVHRLGEELFPLLDRANRLMLRNLKALNELQLPPRPNVTIGLAGQVNVGQQQVHAVAGSRPTRPTLRR
jgi:hypothetical protein